MALTSPPTAGDTNWASDLNMAINAKTEKNHPSTSPTVTVSGTGPDDLDTLAGRRVLAFLKVTIGSTGAMTIYPKGETAPTVSGYSFQSGTIIYGSTGQVGYTSCFTDANGVLSCKQENGTNATVDVLDWIG